METKKKGGFSGSLGFVLAAAGSAVGVGNIWRFPYLAAKHGGGLFLLVYLILVLTFGFTLLTTDITLGRKTKLSPLKAFSSIRPKWGFMGKLTFLVPAIIITYYIVIGGWILKYGAVYMTGAGAAAAQVADTHHQTAERAVADDTLVVHPVAELDSHPVKTRSDEKKLYQCLVVPGAAASGDQLQKVLLYVFRFQFKLVHCFSSGGTVTLSVRCTAPLFYIN
jgi:hypothetical protein